MAASSAGVENDEVVDYGLTQVFAPTGGGKVDIVFVHGLNGHPKKTWTSEKSKVFWPLQLLPPILTEQRARILVYGYDATVASFTDGVSRDKIHNHAENLIATLSANRRMRQASERPIIFVAHSLGGLVVKRALIYSSGIKADHTAHLRSIFVSTFGVLFMGTPHRGSDLAKWGSLLESICHGVIPSGIVDSNDALVNALKRENEMLQVIDRDFYTIMSRFRVYFFHEGKKTNLGRMKMAMVVDEESASPNAQDVERSVIQQDHSHMCKFENDLAPGFDLVADALQRYSDEAPEKVEIRWRQEKDERFTQQKYFFEEKMPASMRPSPKTDSPKTDSSTQGTPSTVASSKFTQDKEPTKPSVQDTATNTPSSPTSTKSEPYFIVPPGFRPNSFFEGMKKELDELDRCLFDKKRRSMGTACALLYGQPGGGKTHLARQYVNKNRKKFPGGIFWAAATTIEELRHSFSDIKQKVVTRDGQKFFEGISGCEVAQPVKNWFQSRSEWLIVFDGVQVETDEDATELSKFIPDSRNASIIYVSRASNLESKQRLLRPVPIRVGPLKDEEAKRLLFSMVNIPKPNEAENRKATELVKQVGGLPMAIDAISHRLSDTHEPLARFKLSYSNSPALENTYNQILSDLRKLGHAAAWRLINILCWYGHHIPVEMVRLGLRPLKRDQVEVRSASAGAEPDINTTFSILMRYALIERNEPDSDKTSSSSSHDSLIEPEPIDMLRMHGVVQTYCCDSLNKNEMLPTWLGHAINMFVSSYYHADSKIKQKTAAGRVSDYRYYLVHGQQLWDHIETYETAKQDLSSCRLTLNPVLEKIKDEIMRREPANSSQESLKSGVFQISIFDRSSSSSDSVQPGQEPRTPNYRPTPPPLDGQSMYGLPVDKPELDSPASFSTASPGHPRIVGYSPHNMPFDYPDAGYISDNEGSAMRRKVSEGTERPRSRSRASTLASQSSSWQLAPPTRNPRQRLHRDLGSFRPTPAKISVSKESARGSMGVPASEAKQTRRDSSPAQDALKEVQSRSPPESKGSIVDFLRHPFNRSNTENEKPSWAHVAAGPKTSQPAVDGKKHSPPAAPLILNKRKSREDSRLRRTSAGSPLATEFVPRPDLTDGSQRMDEDFVLYPSDDQDAVIEQIPYRGPPASYTPAYQTTTATFPIPLQPSQEINPTPFLGANQAPLPIDNNITISSNQPTPVTYQAALPSSFSQSLPDNAPYYYIPVTNRPVHGYTSTPMSRDQSQQSQGSIAETEPPPYPTDYSPDFRPARLPFTPVSNSQSNRQSPHTRAASISPHSAAVLAPPPNSSSPATAIMPRAPGDTPPNTFTSGLPQHSRSASGGAGASGPGIAIDQGLAGVGGAGGGLNIVGFSDQIQFGGQEFVSIEEAQNRARQLAYLQQARQQQPQPGSGPDASIGGTGHKRWVSASGPAGVSAREGASGNAATTVYPYLNLIPTSSDAGAGTLREMVGDGGDRNVQEERGGRPLERAE